MLLFNDLDSDVGTCWTTIVGGCEELSNFSNVGLQSGGTASFYFSVLEEQPEL
jgi:hypothetical protein